MKECQTKRPDRRQPSTRPIEDYDQAIWSDPNNAYAFKQSRRRLREQRPDRPRTEDFNQAIRLDPSSVLAFINRGNIYGEKASMTAPSRISIGRSRSTRTMRRRSSTEAFPMTVKVTPARLEDYQRAIQLDPNDAEGVLRRGANASDAGLASFSIYDFDRAIELDPPMPMRSAAAASPMPWMTNTTCAIADFSRATPRPNDAMAFSNRGNAYLGKANATVPLRTTPCDQARSEQCSAVQQSRHRLSRRRPVRPRHRRFQLGDRARSQRRAMFYPSRRGPSSERPNRPRRRGLRRSAAARSRIGCSTASIRPGR